MNVIEVGFDQARHLIMAHHYAHRMPTIQRAFALMECGLLVGVVTFGQPASPWVKPSMMGKDWAGEILELNRLVVVTKTKNAASFLVGAALRLLPKDVPLVSYADQGAGHVGYIYQATNWHYSGEPTTRVDRVVSGESHSRHVYEGELMSLRRSQKHRYWYCRDKALAKACLWKSLPYPKGPTKRHEAEEVPFELS